MNEISNIPTNDFINRSTSFTLVQTGSLDEFKRLTNMTFGPSNRQSTGIYKKYNETVEIYVDTDTDQTVLPRYILTPVVLTSYLYGISNGTQLRRGLNVISIGEGLIHLINESNTTKIPAKVTISGGQNIPRFILGQTTDEQWKSIVTSYPSAPAYELVSKDVIITGGNNTMKKVTYPTELMSSHDKSIDEANRVAGFDGSSYLHPVNDKFKHHMIQGTDDGYMYAYFNHTGYSSEGMNYILNLQNFTQDGWGPWHEVGHTYQSYMMDWNGLGETTNNIFSLSQQRFFKQKSRLEEDGKYKLAFDYLRSSNKDFYKIEDVFISLVMFWQLDLAFGKDFYPKVFKMYRELNEAEGTDYTKQQRFMIVASIVAKMNLISFFDMWGMKPSNTTINFINAIDLPKLNANIWESTDSNPIKPDPITDLPKLVFPVISDTQMDMGSTANMIKFDIAMQQLYELAPNQDALVVVGDLTDNGYNDQYQRFFSVFNKYKNAEAINMFSMGNHDYWNGLSDADAQKRFLQETKMDSIYYHKVVKGYHFIVLSPENGTTHGYYSNKQIDWFKLSLSEAKKDDASKPIFVFLHQHIKGTVWGSEGWGNNQKELYDALANYPQAITFSGHSHYPIDDPAVIHQRDFTSVGTASISYMEVDSGYIQGNIPPGAYELSQGLIVEVYDDKVIIKRRDFHVNDWTGDPWIINTNITKDKFIYTDARDKINPYFKDDDKIELVYGIKSIKITFPQAIDNELVRAYNISVKNKQTGNIVKSFKAYSEFYRDPVPQKLSFTIDEIDKNINYEIRVDAIDSFGNYSKNSLILETNTSYPDPTPDPGEIDNFTFNIHPLLNINKVIDSRDPSGILTIWSKNNGTRQNFKFKYDSIKKAYQILRADDENYAVTMNEVGEVFLVSNIKIDSQYWILENSVDGYTIIKSKYNFKLALDLSGSMVDDGSEVIVYNYHGGNNQKWKLVRSN